MARTDTSETLSSHVYTELRRAILNGVYAPGDRLKPSELRLQYDVSVSVVREALSRLAEQRLVRGQHNQGFRVMELTGAGLRELTNLRVLIEGYALRESVNRGDIAWESRVLATHHLLINTPARAADDPDHTTEEWAAAHHDFHRALISACGMPLLLEICDSLFDSSELYRRLSAPLTEGSKRDVACEHRQLCEAAIARDADLAVARLRDHFTTTTEILVGLLVDAGPT